MKFTIIGVICAIFIMSCSDDTVNNYSVGADFLDNNINVKVIDTFTINTGTFKLDSVITSGTNRILLGSINDSYLGKLTTQSYFQLYNPTFNFDYNAVYDSIGFVLNYDTYYYGDTLVPQTYKIHRVLETVKPKDVGANFYNTSTLKFDEESLGEITFTPRPNTTTDSLYIPMKDELGKEIFNKIVNNEINNLDDFLQYFKGLTIVPNTLSNSQVLGFNAYASLNMPKNSSMRLYYSIKNENGEDDEGLNYYVDFVIYSADKQFNAIKTDVSDMDINNLKTSETIISSTQTNHLFYSQSGSGVSARIDIPSLKKLKENSENGTSLSAELTFSALKSTYNKYNPLKDSLSVYIIDKKNRIISQLTDIDGNASYAILKENEFENNIYYSINLNGFVENILGAIENLNYSLMIQFVDINKSVDRVIIDAPEKESSRVKLTVKYLNY